MYRKNESLAGAVIVLLLSLVLAIPLASLAADPPVPATPPILDNIPPAWSRVLPAAQRFDIVLNGEGVLDKETGLVWQRTLWRSLWTWDGARAQCNVAEIGGRLGWHLPTVEQLTTLLDRTTEEGPKLPAGHPFLNFGGRYPYLTASPYPGAPGAVFEVDFTTGDVGGVGIFDERHIWCVRGGQSYIAY